MQVLGDHIAVIFHDATTLYFETDRQDDLRKTGTKEEPTCELLFPSIFILILYTR